MHSRIHFTRPVRRQRFLRARIVVATADSRQHWHGSYGVEHFFGLAVFLLLDFSIDVLLLRMSKLPVSRHILGSAGIRRLG